MKRKPLFKYVLSLERVIKRLSRMMGNCHVRFLKGKAVVTPLTYLTLAMVRISYMLMGNIGATMRLES